MSTIEGNDTNQYLIARMVRNAHVPFRLRPNMRINRVWIDDASVRVQVTVYDTTETAREIRFRRRGIRLMSWTGVRPNGTFEKYDEFTSWDDDFVPYVERRYGRTETPDERRARRDWEGMQYRVGTAKSPMDSAGRVLDGDSPMFDYWMKD